MDKEEFKSFLDKFRNGDKKTEEKLRKILKLIYDNWFNSQNININDNKIKLLINPIFKEVSIELQKSNISINNFNELKNEFIILIKDKFILHNNNDINGIEKTILNHFYLFKEDIEKHIKYHKSFLSLKTDINEDILDLTKSRIIKIIHKFVFDNLNKQNNYIKGIIKKILKEFKKDLKRQPDKIVEIPNPKGENNNIIENPASIKLADNPSKDNPQDKIISFLFKYIEDIEDRRVFLYRVYVFSNKDWKIIAKKLNETFSKRKKKYTAGSAKVSFHRIKKKLLDLGFDKITESLGLE